MGENGRVNIGKEARNPSLVTSCTSIYKIDCTDFMFCFTLDFLQQTRSFK